MERDQILERIADGLTALAFTVAVATPLTIWAVTGEADQSLEREHRTPAPRPTLSLDPATLEAFRLEFPAWYDDAFRLRGSLVRWHSLVKLVGFGVSPSSEVVVGEDGWLYFTGDRVLDSCRGLDPFTEDELERWRTALEERRDWLAARDVEFLFTVAPDKHTVYPELLPAAYRVPGVRTRLDQLSEYLARNSGVRAVELAPRLREEATRRGPEKPIYFQRGTHWNDRGALVAYRTMLAALPPELGLGEAWSEADFRDVDQALEIDDWVGDTWAEQMLIEDVVTQEAMVYVPRDSRPRLARLAEIRPAAGGLVDGVAIHPDQSLPRIVLFRDSFANWLWYFLAEHASRLAVDSASRFDPELVVREGADLVICELVERKLMTIQPLSGVNRETVDQARRWLPGLELELAVQDGGASVALTAAARVLLRVRFEAGPAGQLGLRWRDATGAEHDRELTVSAGRDWVFLEPEGLATSLELDFGALDGRVLEVRGRRTP